MLNMLDISCTSYIHSFMPYCVRYAAEFLRKDAVFIEEASSQAQPQQSTDLMARHL